MKSITVIKLDNTHYNTSSKIKLRNSTQMLKQKFTICVKKLTISIKTKYFLCK